MKKRGTALSLILALLVGLAPWLPGLAQTAKAQEDTGLGYIVKLRSDVAVPLAADSLGESLGLGMYLVDSAREAETLAETGAVEFIEPNYPHYLCANGLVNDRHYANNNQWNLDFMQMGPLWARGLTGEGVIVAVIDTGLSDHEDLDPARMLPGLNVVNEARGADDIDNHGSFVSGVIAAQANNTVGVAGVAHRADILPYMVFREGLVDDKIGILATAADIAKAIRLATDSGADVINLSLSSPSPSDAVRTAVDYAVGKGVIVVAAAGNDGNEAMGYPAGYAGVIGVGALDKDGSRASYSNYNTSVFVSAPGTAMYSVVVRTIYGMSTTTSYGALSGTSFAAPCVSALAALAKEDDPAINAHQFENLLRLTADDRGDEGWDPYYGYGSINAANLAAALGERTITYDLNGGQWQEGEPKAAQTAFRVYQDEDVTLPVPVREGYAFMGWYRQSDLSGAPEEVLTLPALEEDVTYTAKWLDDNTALAFVTYTLDGADYPCPFDEGDDYRLYLPHGTDLSEGVLTAEALSPTTDIYITRDDTDPGRWTVRATPESGRAKDYRVFIDTSLHAPAPAEGQPDRVEATVHPSSMDTLTPAQTYAADLSAWFNDPDSPQLTYILDDLTVDGVAAEREAVPTLRLEGDSLSFTPMVGDVGKVISFAVSASDGRFTSPKITVAITVGDIPDDQPEPPPPPSESVPPSECESPSESVPPSESEDPSESAPPTESEGPTESVPPSESEDPSGSVPPSESETPTPTPTPTPPSESVPPSESENPSESVPPSESENPSESVPPSESESPSESIPPVESERPTESEKPGESPSASPSPGPSTGGSSGSWGGARRPSQTAAADPPATPAATPPAALVTQADGSARLELAEGESMTQAQRQAVVQANARGPVTVQLPHLRVFISAGTVTEEDQVAGLLPDGSEAKAGDVVMRTDDRGERHPVPLALVTDGQVAYVATAPGVYTLERRAVSFADAENHWARDAIGIVAARDLTRGMRENVFDPEGPATRAMIFTLLARLEGTELPASQGAWYDSAVTWAMGRSLTDGTRPQENVKRQELVTLLWRWAGKPLAQNPPAGFTDLDSVAPYAWEALSWAAETGILAGRPDGSLDPLGPATRAETAVVLERFITYFVKAQTGI